MRALIRARFAQLGVPAPSDSAIENIAVRVAGGESLSRATGVAFFGDTVCETENVLCPRADSECLVEAALQHTAKMQSPWVCDLGAGSGALLIWYLQCRPDAKGLGMDVCPKAVAVAKRNAFRNGVGERARFLLRDWHDSLPDECASSFDVALWNPPYVPTQLCKGVADPLLALDGGADGLDCYKTPPLHLLRPGGLMFVEIGQGARVDVVQLIKGAALRQVYCDLQGLYRKQKQLLRCADFHLQIGRN